MHDASRRDQAGAVAATSDGAVGRGVRVRGGGSFFGRKRWIDKRKNPVALLRGSCEGDRGLITFRKSGRVARLEGCGGRTIGRPTRLFGTTFDPGRRFRLRTIDVIWSVRCV